MSRKMTVGLLAAAVGGLLVESVVVGQPGTARVGPIMKLPESQDRVLEGDFDVTYAIGGFEHSISVPGVRRIEFHDECVVLHGRPGTGRVVSLANIAELKWSPS